MIHIKVQFHTNQYQACAWGNNHAEGVIDWPPAPWRILRAIVAGAYNANLPEKDTTTLKTLLHKLASALPNYTLPPVSYIQHRSPRPQVDTKTVKVRSGKTLYAAGLLMSSEQNELYIHWPVALSEAEKSFLGSCLSGLTYFGRKESTASLTLVETAPEANTTAEAEGTEIVAIADANLGEDALWKALTLSPHENYAVHKSAIFPGVKQATYQIRRPKTFPRQETTSKKQHSVTLSVSASPQVPLKFTLKLTHRLHQEFINRCPAPIFTGQEMGKPRQNHNHTIFQCLPDRTGRYIQEIYLYSHEGYNSEALATIGTAVNQFKLKNVAQNYQGSLSLADFGSQIVASEWSSCTPFFLSRYPATRRGKPRMLTEHFQKDSPEHQALQYLQYLPWLGLTGEPSYHESEEKLALYLDNELAVIVTNCQKFPRYWEWESKCRQGKKVGRIGYALRLKFMNRVQGPIALGYACHYGLGTLTPLKISASG